MKKVVVVVLNYNNYSDTLLCLNTILSITYENTELVVVDNHSGNDSLERIAQYLLDNGIDHARVDEGAIDECREYAERTFLLQSSSNRGYAAGNNLGIRVALTRGADYVLLLNNDTLVDANFLAPLVEYAETHERVGAVGPMIMDSENRITRVCARRRPTAGDFLFSVGIGRRLFPNNHWVRSLTYEDEYDFKHPKEVDVLSGSCMLVKSSTLRETGLLDENTFLYAEEFIFHERLRAVGLTSVVVPSSTIVHKSGQATAKTPSKMLRATEERSLKYYWTHYRHYNRGVVAVLIVLSRSPMEFFRRLLKPRG